MMDKQKTISRRTLIKTAGCGVGLAAATCHPASSFASERDDTKMIQMENREFYADDGSFQVDKAKQGIVQLCKYHGYPIFPEFEKNLWVSDYGTGQFAKLGLAAYIFVNNVEDRYMLLDLFLLPGQMLPEHWHVEGEGNPAKREGWLVRWGKSHIVGIGERNLCDEVVIPECHWGGKVTTQHEVIATPGTFVPLAKVGTRHWQYGGPQGAIVTEVANVHTSSAVRHTDPALNKYFLESL
jgi:D-lyxose ketol-isomerase